MWVHQPVVVSDRRHRLDGRQTGIASEGKGSVLRALTEGLASVAGCGLTTRPTSRGFPECSTPGDRTVPVGFGAGRGRVLGRQLQRASSSGNKDVATGEDETVAGCGGRCPSAARSGRVAAVQVLRTVRIGSHTEEGKGLSLRGCRAHLRCVEEVAAAGGRVPRWKVGRTRGRGGAAPRRRRASDW